MKSFFKKIGDYIKNTAWIQPLLIVVIIFLILFLLNPIKTGITNLWNRITTNSNMQSITYKEYVEMVKKDAEDDSSSKKYIFVFVQKDCEYCAEMYNVMNQYLKETKGSRDFEIYSLNVTTKTKNSTKIYKDKTMGNADGSTSDMIKQLDQRVEDYVNIETNDSNYNSADLSTVSEGSYRYVSTPFFIWYENGIEVKISNTFDNSVTNLANGKKSYTSFKEYISFPTSSIDWDEEFDLSYAS